MIYIALCCLFVVSFGVNTWGKKYRRLVWRHPISPSGLSEAGTRSFPLIISIFFIVTIWSVHSLFRQFLSSRCVWFISLDGQQARRQVFNFLWFESRFAWDVIFLQPKWRRWRIATRDSSRTSQKSSISRCLVVFAEFGWTELRTTGLDGGCSRL